VFPGIGLIKKNHPQGINLVTSAEIIMEGCGFPVLASMIRPQFSALTVKTCISPAANNILNHTGSFDMKEPIPYRTTIREMFLRVLILALITILDHGTHNKRQDDKIMGIIFCFHDITLMVKTETSDFV
jgi:hypothetical protein